MRACEIWWLNESATEELMGRFILEDDGTLTSEWLPGNENAILDIQARPNVSGRGSFDRHTQTEAWFDALPVMYHGSRMWAQVAVSKSSQRRPTETPEANATKREDVPI